MKTFRSVALLPVLFLLLAPKTVAACDPDLTFLYGLDSEAAALASATPVKTTVKELNAKNADKPTKSATRTAEEKTVWEVTGKLIYLGEWVGADIWSYRLHSQNFSIPVYVPKPTCTAESPLASSMIPFAQDGFATIHAPAFWIHGDANTVISLGPVLKLAPATPDDGGGDGGGGDEGGSDPEPEPVPEVTVVIPDFVSGQALKAGDVLNFDVFFQPQNGFDSKLSLSAISVPDDLEITIDPETIPAPGSGRAQVTIHATERTFPMMHIVTISSSGENGQISDRALLFDVICDPPMILGQVSNQPSSVTVDQGQRATLQVRPSRGTSPLKYQWYEGAGGSEQFPIAGATGSTFITPPITRETSFWARVSNMCGSVDSWSAVVTPSGAAAIGEPSSRRRTSRRPNP